jgi:hypothetical protein
MRNAFIFAIALGFGFGCTPKTVVTPNPTPTQPPVVNPYPSNPTPTPTPTPTVNDLQLTYPSRVAKNTPVNFQIKTSNNVVRLRLFANDASLGTTDVANGQGVFPFTFAYVGTKKLRFVATDANGATVYDKPGQIEIY